MVWQEQACCIVMLTKTFDFIKVRVFSLTVKCSEIGYLVFGIIGRVFKICSHFSFCSILYFSDISELQSIIA